MPPTPSAHRLQPGLPGYLILFAPPAFVPQSQVPSSRLPTPSVFLPISTHFTATPGIPATPPALQPASIDRRSAVGPRHFTADSAGLLRTLYAQ